MYLHIYYSYVSLFLYTLLLFFFLYLSLPADILVYLPHFVLCTLLFALFLSLTLILFLSITSSSLHFSRIYIYIYIYIYSLLRLKWDLVSHSTCWGRVYCFSFS